MKMNRRQSMAVASLAVLLWGVTAAQAQFAGSNQTNLINHATNNWSGAYYVGTNASSDVLIVTNAGRLANSLGYLGYEAGDSNNLALVTGAGSVWANGSDLVIGNSGSGNLLTIAKSGKVFNAYGYIGNNASSSNNAVLVTDAGCIWSNSANLNVGWNGSGNMLTLANGAKAVNSYGYVGALPGANNNAATVTGPGSIWSNRFDFFVGYYSAGNSLTITNHGTVSDGLVYIGANTGASNNTVTVTGSGSVWTNGNGVYVGLNGSGNLLTIASSGTVYASNGSIGENLNANNNRVIVTGAGAVWNNSGMLSVGSTSSGNQLTIANGGAVYDTLGYIGLNFGFSNNVVVVTGPGSVWNNSADLSIGNQSYNNTLTISNQGSVLDDDGLIGYNSTATKTSVTVTGPGSVWSNNGSCFVGYAGATNTLLIANGGTVIDADAFIGSNATARGNTVLVTDAGSAWQNSATLNVGYSGSFNALVITNRGTVNNTIGYIGYNAGANSNTVVVTGSGSVWTNNGALYVGNSNAFSLLTIANSGAVFNTTGYIGFSPGASNNAVTVTGAGSVWANTGDLTVGFSGSGNLLTIANNGSVLGANSYLGYNAGANSNAILVTGSAWTNSSAFAVGLSGSGNTLTITNLGTVVAGLVSIGANASASNNAVSVAGPGSVWMVNSDLYVGNFGAGNMLTIANGGTVSNAVGCIGADTNAANNAVLVTGAGSVWSNRSNLYVGYYGSSNNLTVAANGTVAAPAVTVGFAATSSNNTVALHGGSLIATSAANGAFDIRQGAVTMDSGTMQAQAVWLTNGLAGTLSLTGGTLMANLFTNSGGANASFSGCTLMPLNADANWSGALVLLGGVTINTLDANGQARSVNLSGTVSGGAVLNVTGFGALLLNGTVSGGGLINVFPGARLGGTGSAESVQIQSNATLGVGTALGAFIATNLTLNGGAHFQEGLNATSGVAGVDWDLVSVTGAVTLNGLSNLNPLTVDVVNLGGLNGSNVPLNAISWTILTAAGGISGFNPQGFAVTTTGLIGWSNGLWSVTQTNNSLQLVYSPPVPVSVTVLANPTNGGSATGGGIYPSGSHVQITAVPTNGWSFTGWNDGSKNNPYTITVPQTNITYTATFAPPGDTDLPRQSGRGRQRQWRRQLSTGQQYHAERRREPRLGLPVLG